MTPEQINSKTEAQSDVSPFQGPGITPVVGTNDYKQLKKRNYFSGVLYAILFILMICPSVAVLYFAGKDIKLILIKSPIEAKVMLSKTCFVGKSVVEKKEYIVSVGNEREYTTVCSTANGYQVGENILIHPKGDGMAIIDGMGGLDSSLTLFSVGLIVLFLAGMVGFFSMRNFGLL